MFSMNKQRKIFNIILITLTLIMVVATPPVIIIGEICSKPNDWLGYIIMTIIDLVCAFSTLIITAVFLPKISKVEKEKQIFELDFNVLRLSDKVNNKFEIYHYEIINAEFLEDKVVFKRVKFDSMGRPVLKNEPNLVGKKLQVCDLCTFDMEVPYSKLKFSVVTNRKHWSDVPNIGIAIEFDKEVVDSFFAPDNFAIMDASKEALLYILGYGNKLTNSELLNEKQLIQKPKVVKKFITPKLPVWQTVLFFIEAMCAGIGLGIWINLYVGIMIGVVAAFVILKSNKLEKIMFYKNYVLSGSKIFSIKEIIKVKKQSMTNGGFRILIETPAFIISYPYRDDLWNYLYIAAFDKIKKE